MIKRYNDISFLYGIPGVLLQIAGPPLSRLNSTANRVDPLMFGLGLAVVSVGTLLLVVGFAYYAKAKGHHPAWGIVALLSCVGLFVLAMLPDRWAPPRSG